MDVDVVVLGIMSAGPGPVVVAVSWLLDQDLLMLMLLF